MIYIIINAQWLNQVPDNHITLWDFHLAQDILASFKTDMNNILVHSQSKVEDSLTTYTNIISTHSKTHILTSKYICIRDHFANNINMSISIK